MDERGGRLQRRRGGGRGSLTSSGGGEVRPRWPWGREKGNYNPQPWGRGEGAATLNGSRGWWLRQGGSGDIDWKQWAVASAGRKRRGWEGLLGFHRLK